VPWVKRRWYQYLHYYVDSVYTNLYLWYHTEQPASQTAAESESSGD
jgi:hypothetical protein